MQLLNTQDVKEYEIYDIYYDSDGAIYFLIYQDNQWLRVPAMHFTPNYEKVFYRGRDAYFVDEKLLQNESDGK